MRISDNRYSRDLRRYNLAWEMIGYEVRTGTIRAWTGLSGNRIRTLYQAYTQGHERSSPPRHRGVSPFQLQYFTRSRRVRREATVFGAVCRLMHVLPAQPVANAAVVLPGVARGELLCLAFQAFREMVPQSDLTFERAALLFLALAEAEELRLATCRNCHAALIIDRLDVPRAECSVCDGETSKRAQARANAPAVSAEADDEDLRSPRGRQGGLFD
jgi:hypothetical protein